MGNFGVRTDHILDSAGFHSNRTSRNRFSVKHARPENINAISHPAGSGVAHSPENICFSRQP
jgi:hypothetical protein